MGGESKGRGEEMRDKDVIEKGKRERWWEKGGKER